MKDFGSQDPKPTFLHKDYLGSILAITDTDGNVLESRHFDAWGTLTHGEIKLLDRGYTSHEHLQDVGLIHMNGRLYDPLMRRFLNADENIQDPYNTQNYNKYGYVLNNPLMFNDPSGEELVTLFLGVSVLVWKAVIIGAAIGLATYVASTSLLTTQQLSWSGAIKATIWGAIGGAVSFGVGDLFSAVKNGVQTITPLCKSLGGINSATVIFAKATCHAVSQGVLSLMQGGNFLSGAASGFMGSLGASAWGLAAPKWSDSTIGTISFGALSGGIGAELTGGNFWQGALIGGMVAGLNHAMHKMEYRKTLREKFHGLDPNAKPELTEEYITGTLNKHVDGLEDAYNLGQKPTFYTSDESNSHGAEHNLSTSNKIKLFAKNLTSNYRLASSLFHEYRHAYQTMTPMLGNILSKYGPLGPETYYTRSRALMEWDAYNFQINVGGEVDGFILGQRDLMKKYFELK